MALAWLAQLVLLPFDLALLDSSLGAGDAAAGCVDAPHYPANRCGPQTCPIYDLNRLTSTCSSVLGCASLWPGFSDGLASLKCLLSAKLHAP